ncbi:MAG: hypothetical protein RI571_06545 [Roseovarius sp.]|nr:hypothetical protein [Roseovarius sp.]
MHTANYSPPQADTAPAAPPALLYRFHVALSWRTTSGTLATAARVKVAASEAQAIRFARHEITRDRRRRYAGRFQAQAIMIPNEEPGQ